MFARNVLCVISRAPMDSLKLKESMVYLFFGSIVFNTRKCLTQSRIIGAVRGAHSQLWETTLPVFSPYASCKYDKRFGTPAIV